jgi:hypothetical protein
MKAELTAEQFEWALQKSRQCSIIEAVEQLLSGGIPLLF